MSEKKPTYKELSSFGQCVADKHFANSIAGTAQNTKPPANATKDSMLQ